MVNGYKDRARAWWIVIAFGFLFLLAGCGGSSGEDSANNQQSQPPGNRGPSSNSQQVPSEGGSNQPSSAPPVSAANPCNAFSMVAGAGPTGGFISQAFGGPDVDTSRSPQSDFARAVAQFAEEALEQVFEGDVTADCFFEATTGDEGGAWISLTLPGAPPSGAHQAAGDAMATRGATISGTFSTSTPDGTFDLVALDDLPVEAPGGVVTTGALYFVTGQEGSYLAVMTVGYQAEGGRQASDATPTAASQSAATPEPRDPTPTPAVAAPAPSGIAATINDGLQPALEEAFGVGLVVESHFQTAAGGNSSVTISYVVQEEVPAGSDPMEKLTQVVEDLGGTVTASMASGGGGSVIFDGLQIADFTSSGNFTLSDNQITAIFATLSSS